MEPPYELSELDNAELWVVWRIDDNGNTFVVKDRITKQAAERLVEEFTARGHKQTYWAEKANPA